MRLKQLGMIFAGCAVVGAVAFSCGEKKDDDKDDEAAGDGGDDSGTDAGDGTNIPAGQIALAGVIEGGAALVDGGSVTHVIVTDTDSNESTVKEVGEDGSYSLNIPKGQNYTLTFIDNSKTGEEMLVSTFGSGELDTIPTSDSSTNIDLGTTNVSGEQATTATTGEAIMTAAGASAEAAATWSAIDDASLRATNPDVDADGQVDAVANQKFPLDFHNRFNVVDKTGGAMAMKDLKNAFPPADADVQFTGSGIIPWFEDSVYSTPLDKYTWTFSVDAVLGTSGGVVCEGMNAGDTLPANTECKMTASDAASGGKKPSLELAAAVAGKYTLKAGGKTFTWPNVKVSDFSGGKGFLALFLRMDVSDDDKLTGISHKWMIKTDAGAWRLAKADEIKLIVSGAKGFVSLKVDGMNSGKELGVMVSGEPEGSVKFADAVIATSGSGESADAQVMLPTSGVTENDVKAGIEWSRVLENPGISYDDKLGMRFFIGFNGQND